MTKRKNMLRILSLLMLLMLLTCLMPLAAQAAQRRTVRVGIFPLGQFHNIDANGKVYGYDVDYLSKICQAAHWNIEYVISANWSEATQQLANGEIDLLAPAQKTESLQAQFAYATYAMGAECGAIYALKDSHDIVYGDYSAISALHFGIPAGSTFAKQFLTEYCPQAGFTPNATEYANMTDLFVALYAGEVDAVVTNIMFAADDLSLLGRFELMPVYYIARQDDATLLRELDDAMASIRVNSPSFETELQSAYFPIYGNTQFTYDELQFIKNNPVINIGYVSNREPLSYLDENGECVGVTRAILDRLAEMTGFSFQYVPLPGGQISGQYLADNNISILSSVELNDVNNDLNSMQLSRPYLSSEKVFAAATDNIVPNSNSALTVALSTGSNTLVQALQQQYPNFTVKTYDSVEESFEAVMNGEADMLMQNRYVTERLLAKPRYNKMRVVPVQSMSDEMCLATLYFGDEGNAENVALCDGPFLTIMDKAIQQLSTSDVNAIVIEQTLADPYRLTPLDTLYQYRYALSGLVVVLTLLIILQLRNAHLKQQQNEMLSVKNRQLSSAINQAQRANNAKSQFLARMSHEIRTPMNAIVGLTSIAKAHETDPAKIDEYLTKIESSSRVLLNIINDVLDMSAIESDKLKIASEPFDLKALLKGISDIYYTQCKQKGIRFDMYTGEVNTESLVGDALRVNQILLNLISNAYKFTDAGNISVRVFETSRKDKQVFLRFIVSDTGCGMGEDMKQRLFKPFEQENAVIAKSHGGSGLGLSITKTLVEMMHGAIAVQSEKGVGTTFTVDLPFTVSDEDISPDTEKLKDVHALVVDDDPDACAYTAQLLARIGVPFEIAHNGESAVQMLTSAHKAGKGYDICFVDWKMPNVSGIDVTRKIRELFDEKTVIIIVSAYDLSEVEAEARAAGANLFVAKPLFQSTVFNLLMRLTGGKYTKETADSSEYNFTGHKVLLAEDNDLNAEIAKELLSMANMESDRAENGNRAVEMFQDAPIGTYDAILMDIQMPELDGYGATRAIRALSRSDAATMPIYAMTANAFTEDVAAALSAGMNGHIAKPIDTKVLYSTLQKVVQKQALQATATPDTAAQETPQA